MGAQIPPGLARVAHDGSLSGDGTTRNPLRIGTSAIALDFIYTANGTETDSFTLTIPITMPSTAFNAKVFDGGCAVPLMIFSVILSSNTTTTIVVISNEPLTLGDKLQVEIRERTS